MRKLLFFTFAAVSSIVAVAAYAGIIKLSKIGPSNATANVTIAAAGTGNRNCLNGLEVQSDSAYQLNVLNGATTTYNLNLSSGAVLVRSWTDDEFCGSANTALYINVSAGNPRISYTGFVY